ncbi:MAG: Nif11-like leader peptide family natural product precursor [Actinobacteria bacterium]|nr:Nif11-like leader peptide family natural product precursor [Actinomycetota bacterium]MCG2803156.1 Nif11-like leader peptide family natural product precursor [Cellulomonas sp.]
MSAVAAARAPQRAPRQAPRPTPAPPRLRLVRPPAQARTRVPFVLTCMAVLGIALVSALLLNTSMAQVSFASSAQRTTLSRLQQDAKDLQAKIDATSSPEQLATAARALGMVPASGTGWVRLADGTVTGAPAPATK